MRTIGPREKKFKTVRFYGSLRGTNTFMQKKKDTIFRQKPTVFCPNRLREYSQIDLYKMVNQILYFHVNLSELTKEGIKFYNEFPQSKKFGIVY